MTAWERLKAVSSLATGTAWQLLTSPRPRAGVVVNDGVSAVVADAPIEVMLKPETIVVGLEHDQIAATLDDTPIAAPLAGEVVVAVAQPNITAGVRQ